jgi:hypothetical protein
MKALALTLALALVLLLAACAASPPPPATTVPFRGAPATVLVFYSPHCHCLAAHQARLLALYERYHPRGVQFLFVDSEVGATPERDAAEVRAHGYPFSMVTDAGAKLADRVGAQYASYTVVADAQGRIRYRGGIDGDAIHLTDDATPYLANALDDLLAGRDPRTPQAKALGCALQKW